MSASNPFDHVDGMQQLSDYLREDAGIPIEEASAFFVGVRSFPEGHEKTAEWTDPPDMTGELEGQFIVPVEQVLAKLREVIAMKYRKMVAYHMYAQCFRDHAWRAIKIEFGEHACDEKEDAEFYVKRAVALGGPVHMDEIEPPPPSNNPLGILKMMARAEQEAIASQRELLKLVGDENPMRVGIDNALSHDQHHLDEMWQIMTQEEHQSVERPPEDMPMEGGVEGAPEEMMAEGAPPEVPPEAAPPEAAPEALPEAPPPEMEAKTAAMRMAKAFGGLRKAEREKAEKSKTSAVRMRFQKAIMKLAQEPAQEAEAPMAPPTGDMEGTNYLQAELAGRQAQEANESQFYKQELQGAQQQSAAMQQQIADTQMQLDGLQQQAAEAGAQVQEATQQAVAAQDEATRQTQEAARSRIGAQQMRAQMLELASQDPEMFAAQAMPPTPPGPEAMGPPGGPEGMPPEGESPPEGGAPGGPAGGPPPEQPPGPPPPPGPPGGAPPGPPGMAPPGGGPPPPAGPAPKMASVKEASAELLSSALGAGVGAGSALLAGRNAPRLAQKVQDLEAGGSNGSFLQAARLASARKASAAANLAQDHPVGAALAGGLSGAITGPMALKSGRPLVKDFKSAFGKG